jgi:hypothetical protein
MSSQTMPYQFQSYEPGIFVELYLPKKAAYQGKLYEVLTDGFNLEKVKAHFSDIQKRQRIYRLLDDFTEVKNIDGRIDTIQQLYWQFYMYEVDHVYYDPGERIVEEKTQIIRMMFFPNLRKFYELEPEMDHKKVRALINRAMKLDSIERKDISEANPRIIEHLNNWIGDVGLFLFGYVVFELCSRIEELSTTERGELEKEIWVSSFWNFQLNRVKLVFAQ